MKREFTKKRSPHSMAVTKEMQKALVEAATGPGFRARVAAAAALPDMFPGNDGILFKPEWQDDIANEAAPP